MWENLMKLNEKLKLLMWLLLLLLFVGFRLPVTQNIVTVLKVCPRIHLLLLFFLFLLSSIMFSTLVSCLRLQTTERRHILTYLHTHTHLNAHTNTYAHRHTDAYALAFVLFSLKKVTRTTSSLVHPPQFLPHPFVLYFHCLDQHCFANSFFA